MSTDSDELRRPSVDSKSDVSEARQGKKSASTKHGIVDAGERQNSVANEGLREAREQIARLQADYTMLQNSTLSLEEARSLTYKALFKGAALQRIATIVDTLSGNLAARKLALSQLQMAANAVAGKSVDVRRALADGLNRRGWEDHLQMMRREQLTLLAENARLLEKALKKIIHQLEKLKAEPSTLQSPSDKYGTTSKETRFPYRRESSVHEHTIQRKAHEVEGATKIQEILSNARRRQLMVGFYTLYLMNYPTKRLAANRIKERQALPICLNYFARARDLLHCQIAFFRLWYYGHGQRTSSYHTEEKSRLCHQSHRPLNRPTYQGGVSQEGMDMYGFALEPVYYSAFPSRRGGALLSHNYIASSIPPPKLIEDTVLSRRQLNNDLAASRPPSLFFRPNFDQIPKSKAQSDQRSSPRLRETEQCRPMVFESDRHRAVVEDEPLEGSNFEDYLGRAYEQLVTEMLEHDQGVDCNSKGIRS